MSILVAVLCALSLMGSASGAALTWDSDAGTAGAQDGGGTWDVTAANWLDAAGNTNWNNATPDSAIIGAGQGAGGTITLGTGITVGGIVFTNPASGTYTVTSNTITLSGSPVFTLYTNATVDSILAGAGVALTKSGAGTLTLGGVNTYTGATTVNGGTLVLNGSISASSPLVVNSGAAVSLVGSNATGNSSGGTAGPWTVIGGQVSNDGAPDTTQVINGSLTLNGGTLSATATPNVNLGNFLMYNGGQQVIATGDVQSVISGEFHMAGAHAFNVADGAAAVDLLVSGRIGNQEGTAWGQLNKTGSGLLQLSNAGNGFQSLTNTAGTVSVGADGHLGTGGGIVYFRGGKLQVTGSFSTPRIFDGNTSGGTIEVTAGNNLTLSSAGGIRDYGAGTFGFTKTGAGTLTLPAANNQQDTTFYLNEGTVVMQDRYSLGLPDAGTAVAAAGGTRLVLQRDADTSFVAPMSVTGDNATIHNERMTAGAGVANSFGALTVSGPYTLNVTAGTNVTGGTASVAFGAASLAGGTTFNVVNPVAGGTSVLSVGAISGATASVTKEGSGQLTIGGVCSYTNGTTVNGGTLALGAANAVVGTLTVNTGATVRLTAAEALSTCGPITVNGGTLMAAVDNHYITNGLTLNGGVLASAAPATDNNGGGADTDNRGNYTLRSNITAGGTQQSLISADIAIGDSANRTFTVGLTGQPVDLLMSGKLGHQHGTTWGFMTKAGPGTLVLSSARNSIGSITVSAGKVIFQDSMSGMGNGGLINNSFVEANMGPGISAGFGYVAAGTGSLLKTGAGMLTLSGINTYSGATTVSNGTLLVAGRIGTNSVTVTGGAALGGGGTITGPVTLGTDTTLLPGGRGATGTLTVSNSLALSATTTNLFDLTGATGIGGGTNDLVVVSGTLAANSAQILVNPLWPLAAGSYRLFRYAGSRTGNFNTNVLGNSSRQSWTLDTATTNQVNLTVTGLHESLTWRPMESDVWNVSASNWFGAATDRFFDGDSVTFDDSGAYSNRVTLSGLVFPGSVVVSGSSNYVFAGDGSVAGLQGLAKLGSGTLTIANTNLYAGITAVSNGAVRLNTARPSGGALAAYGGGTLEVSGGYTVTNALILAGGTLRNVSETNAYNGAVALTNHSAVVSDAGTLLLGGAVAFGGYTLTLDGASGITLTGLLSGTGRLTKDGTGTVTSVGTLFDYTGSTVVRGTGRLKLLDLDDWWTSGIAISNGAVLELETTARNMRVNTATAITGDGTFVKTGTGLFTTGNSGGYTRWNMSGGWIDVQAGNFVNDYCDQMVAWVNNKASLNVAAGATVTMVGGNIMTVDVLSGAGTVTDNNTWGIGVFTVGANSGTGTFGGTIANGTGVALTKVGTGAQTLLGTNTYTGATTINGGILVLGATASISNSASISLGATGVLDVAGRAGFAVAPGQTLLGFGTVTGTVGVAAGGKLSPGSGPAVGKLTVAGDLTLSATSTNLFKLEAATNDQVAVAGNLQPNGSRISVTPVGTLGVGTYTLFTYSGSLGGSFDTNIANTTRSSWALDTSTTNQVDLVVSSTNSAALVWKPGGINANWDAATTNWLGAAADRYYDGDGVTFDDSGAYSNAVALVAPFYPSAVAVSSASNYTMTGAGRISGRTGLVKSGSGALTLNTTNDFTGPTTIGGGALVIGGAGGLGSGSYAGVISNAGSLTYGSTAAQTFAGAISGTGTVTKSAASDLVLGGSESNTCSGTTTLLAGRIGLAKPAGVAAIAGPFVADNVASPDLYTSADNQFAPGVSMTFVGTTGDHARFELLGTTQTLAGVENGAAAGRGVIQIKEQVGAPLVSGSGALVLDGAGSYFFNGYLRNTGGAFALGKTGSGTQTLAAGNISYTGTTALAGGTLVLSNATAFASPVSIASNATLLMLNSGSWGYGKAISGAGTWVVSGVGVSGQGHYDVTASVNTNFTGTFSLTNGARYYVSSDANFPAASLFVPPGNQIFVVNGAVTRDATIAGTGWQEAAGLLGALRLERSTWSGGLTLADNARVTVYGGGITGSITGPISGDYDLESYNSNGQLFLTGTNTFRNLNVTGGWLYLGRAESAGRGTIVLNNGGLSAFGGSITLTNPVTALSMASYVGYDNGYLPVTFTGSWDFNSVYHDMHIYNTTTIAGNILNAAVAGFYKYESGNLVLLGTNSFAWVNNYNAGGTLTFAGDSVDTISGALTLTTGSTIITNNARVVALQVAGAAQLALLGGELQLGGGGLAGAVTLGSGLLSAYAPWSGISAMTLTGTNSPTRVDTTGGSIALSGALSGTGSLRKLGTGTLTLSGANTYAGTTTVSNGALVVNGTHTGGGAYTVVGGAILGGAGTINAAVGLQPGGRLENGSSNTFGTLTMGSLQFSNATMRALLGAAPAFRVTGTNGFAAAGTNSIELSSISATGTYVVVDYAGTLDPAVFASLTLSTTQRRLGATLVNNTGNTSVDLVVTNLDTLKWTGAVNGAWDINTTTNWQYVSDGVPSGFAQSDRILFDDTATNFTVTAVEGVAPALIAMSNNAASYTVGGGAIAGACAFQKSGTGTVAMAGANTFAGAVTISGGKVIVSTLANGGSASGIGASGAAAANLALNGGTLEYTGLSVGIDRGLTAGAAGATVAVSNAATTLTMGGQVAGTGALTKGGSGVLYLNGNNAYTGATTINAGTLTLNNAGGGAYTYSGGTISINNASTLRISYTGHDQYWFNGKTFVFDSQGGGVIDTVPGINFVVWGGSIFRTTGGAENRITGPKGVNLHNSDSVTLDVTRGSNACDLTVSCPLWNGGGVVKTGSGIASLSATNSYTGATLVNAGTLLVNGWIPGAATVATNAVLGGVGAIGGALTLQSGGIVSPGSNAVGTLTAGLLSVSNNAVFVWEKSAGGADVISVTGTNTLTFGAGATVTLDVRALGGELAPSTKRVLMTYKGSAPATLPTWRVVTTNSPIAVKVASAIVNEAAGSGAYNVVFRLSPTSGGILVVR